MARGRLVTGREANHSVQLRAFDCDLNVIDDQVAAGKNVSAIATGAGQITLRLTRAGRPEPVVCLIRRPPGRSVPSPAGPPPRRGTMARTTSATTTTAPASPRAALRRSWAGPGHCATPARQPGRNGRRREHSHDTGHRHTRPQRRQRLQPAARHRTTTDPEGHHATSAVSHLTPTGRNGASRPGRPGRPPGPGRAEARSPASPRQPVPPRQPGRRRCAAPARAGPRAGRDH